MAHLRLCAEELTDKERLVSQDDADITALLLEITQLRESLARRDSTGSKSDKMSKADLSVESRLEIARRLQFLKPEFRLNELNELVGFIETRASPFYTEQISKERLKMLRKLLDLVSEHQFLRGQEMTRTL